MSCEHGSWSDCELCAALNVLFAEIADQSKAYELLLRQHAREREQVEALTAERDRLAEELKASQADAMRYAMAVGQTCIELGGAKAAPVPAAESDVITAESELYNAPVRIPFSLPDAAIERIYANARRSLRRHMGNVRGQQVMQADAIEYHIINATLDELRDTIDQYAPVPASEPGVITSESELTEGALYVIRALPHADDPEFATGKLQYFTRNPDHLGRLRLWQHFDGNYEALPVVLPTWPSTEKGVSHE